MAHENPKAIEALAELIVRWTVHTPTPLTMDLATSAARAVLANFDLAGKGTLVPFKEWVIATLAAGPYMDVGGTDDQAANCAAEICC